MNLLQKRENVLCGDRQAAYNVESTKMNDVLIVIPTYNNSKTLRHVTQQVIDTGLDLLIVNDGSDDGGPESLEGLAVSIINFPENRGKGAAILAAAEWAERNSYNYIITIDADGQHDPGDLPQFFNILDKSPLSIIVGTRDFSKSDVPSSSRFGRWWSNLWFRISSGCSLPDSQSGFRAYPVKVLRFVKCYGSRYDFEVEILVRSVWAGVEVKPVDISVTYTEETKKASHFDPFWDNFRISIAYTRVVTRNFIPWPHKVLFKKEQKNNDLKLSFFHPIVSLKMLLTENISNKEIVLASMLGIFLGTLPLIATHSVAIIFAATRLRLNRLIALNISHFCMPPLVPAIAIQVGYFLRKGEFLTEFNYQTLGYEAHERLMEYLIGSVLLALPLTLIAGFIVYILIFLIKNIRPLTDKKQDMGG